MTPPNVFGVMFILMGAAFVTGLIIERVRKLQTSRTAGWARWLAASCLLILLGIIILVRHAH